MDKIQENNVEKHNPEEIQLAERLVGAVKDESVLEKFGEIFANAYMTDEESPSRAFRRIFKQYINGSYEIRYIINDIFISLCGYEINTLLDRCMENED